MKYYITFLFAFFFLTSFSQGESKLLVKDTIIPWSKAQKLEWKDFLGALNPDVFAYALTSYKIDIHPENVAVDNNDNILNYKDLTVIANFYKNQSWSVSNDLDLLNHERLHFDIAELFARKIRKRFSELKASEEKRFSVYWNEYSLLWKACRELQKRYDLETNHGVKKTENDNWANKINDLLNSFEMFSAKN